MRSGTRRKSRPVSSLSMPTHVVGPFGAWKVAVAGDGLTIELPGWRRKAARVAMTDNKFVFPSTGGTVIAPVRCEHQCHHASLSDDRRR